MRSSDPTVKIRVSFFMSLLRSQRLLLLLAAALLLLNLQQDLIQMLPLDILWKVGENPRVDQRLQRGQPCLWIDHQYFLKKGTQRRILDERTQRFA